MEVGNTALKAKVAYKNVARVLLNPSYLALAVLSAFLVLGVILWSLNLSLLRYVLIDSGIGASDKLTFFLSVYQGIFSSYDSLQAVSMIIFSTLFGVNIAVLVFVLINQRSRKALPASSALGLGAAVIGGGCIACGTSLLAPILTTLGLFGASSLIEMLGAVFTLLGVSMVLWSLYKLGLLAGTILAKQT